MKTSRKKMTLGAKSPAAAVGVNAIPTVSEVSPAAEMATPPLVLLDRDHSILAFNERVFDWACRREVPLL
jgi:polyphosphate kinase